MTKNHAKPPGSIDQALRVPALRANLNNIQVNQSLQLAAGTVEAKYGGETIIIGSGNDPYAQQTPGQVAFSRYHETINTNHPIKEFIPGEDMVVG